MRSMKTLIAELNGLGLPFLADMTKADLEDILSKAYWTRDHAGEEFPEQIYPMLARAGKDLIEKAEPTETATVEEIAIAENFRNGKWFVQEKVDGCRLVFTLFPLEGKGRATSRRRSDKTYRLEEKGQNVPQVIAELNKVLAAQGVVKAVIDGEIISTKEKIDTGDTVTEMRLQASAALMNCGAVKSLAIQERENWPLKFIYFDLISFEKPGIAQAPVGNEMRWEFLQKYLGEGETYKPVDSYWPATSGEILKIFESLVEKGSEGIIIRKKDGLYEQNKRSKNLWKLKKYETYDGWVTGFIPGEIGKGFEGLVGALEISAFVNGTVQIIAATPNLTLVERRGMSTFCGTLKQEFYGKVVEVRGQEFSKNGRLTHARLLKWRPDKNQEDCQITRVAKKVDFQKG